jgi:hypothetical protein
MLTPDESARTSTNVEPWSLSINAVASSLPELGRVLALDQARRQLEMTQCSVPQMLRRIFVAFVHLVK